MVGERRNVGDSIQYYICLCRKYSGSGPGCFGSTRWIDRKKDIHVGLVAIYTGWTNEHRQYKKTYTDTNEWLKKRQNVGDSRQYK
jgi:hypothetical protein